MAPQATRPRFGGAGLTSNKVQSLTVDNRSDDAGRGLARSGAKWGEVARSGAKWDEAGRSATKWGEVERSGAKRGEVARSEAAVSDQSAPYFRRVHWERRLIRATLLLFLSAGSDWQSGGERREGKGKGEGGEQQRVAPATTLPLYSSNYGVDLPILRPLIFLRALISAVRIIT